jgi:hypothetical protein
LTALTVAKDTIFSSAQVAFKKHAGALQIPHPFEIANLGGLFSEELRRKL